jgi:hypothetical protein
VVGGGEERWPDIGEDGPTCAWPQTPATGVDCGGGIPAPAEERWDPDGGKDETLASGREHDILGCKDLTSATGRGCGGRGGDGDDDGDLGQCINDQDAVGEREGIDVSAVLHELWHGCRPPPLCLTGAGDLTAGAWCRGTRPRRWGRAGTTSPPEPGRRPWRVTRRGAWGRKKQSESLFPLSSGSGG